MISSKLTLTRPPKRSRPGRSAGQAMVSKPAEPPATTSMESSQVIQQVATLQNPSEKEGAERLEDSGDQGEDNNASNNDNRSSNGNVGRSNLPGKSFFFKSTTFYIIGKNRY